MPSPRMRDARRLSASSLRSNAPRYRDLTGQGLATKNPCDYCKPPKRVKPKINALDRAERTRMFKLA
ncbi:hypothetical protein [Olsenella sp. Marseille-P4559]|uniref:hypothetical protein n=1 Tax=Olsenella sp. Marseille-P4559 TaxID=2364795 RepID=UPI001A91FEEB|nr:hypothetical protein [Olsenella sp. Marseille-P4559]